MTTQVLENTNKGSDNNQMVTSYLDITVFRTSNKQKRVPIISKNDKYGKSDH
jgi:hypothetical protein